MAQYIVRSQYPLSTGVLCQGICNPLGKLCQVFSGSRPSKTYKGNTHEPKDWEKSLYMMDSTTISLFDNILKGVGWHPKSGKKKEGMKVHTVMKYHEGVPMVVQLTSAAKHEHYMLRGASTQGCYIGYG